MKIKKLAVCVLTASVVALVGCGGGSSVEPSDVSSAAGSSTSVSSNAGSSAAVSSSSETLLKDGYLDYVRNTLKDTQYEKIHDNVYQRMTDKTGTVNQKSVQNPVNGTSLKMSVQYQKAGTRMKYPTAAAGDNKVSLPYTHGTSVYNAGDFKPTWKALQSNLNFVIDDVTDLQAGDTVAAKFQSWQTAGFAGVDIAQGSSSSIISEGTTAHTILNLTEYLDEMPNFKKFLTDNSAIKNFIQDANGAIYYAPYFDGNDDIERMLMLRKDWVEMLLDGDTLPADATTLANSSYTPFYADETTDKQITVVKADGTGSETVTKKAGENIIAIQNKLTSLSGANLVKALRDYIDATFVKADGTPYYAKRSDLFVGQNAAYNVDELVALYRAVRTCPLTLTGDATKSIIPLFPRDDTNDRTADLWRITQFFGVRGGESRSGYFYVGSDGKIHDSRSDADMQDALLKLNQMYKEGLILANFDQNDATGTTNEFRTELVTTDRGFSTYDYNQTTTILNNNAAFKALNGGNALFTSVLPAVAKWNGSSDYSFFTESWRSVKTEGWFITASVANDQAKLAKALQLFDYLYSEEGNRLMSYGPDDYLAKNADGSIKTMDYQGNQVPVLADSTLDELANQASGNYTNYYRYWLGATLPSGYVKQQGMEYQCVAEAAKPGLDIVNKAIATGVLKHVNFKTDNADKFYNIVPTTFQFNSGETTAVTTNFKDLDSAINNTKGKSNIWSTIVMHGFGYSEGTTTTPAYDGKRK